MAIYVQRVNTSPKITLNQEAVCSECDWEDIGKVKLRKRVIKHVRDTGHKVAVLETKVNTYEL